MPPWTRIRGLELERLHDPDLLARIELLDAERNDLVALGEAAADEDVARLIGLHVHRAQAWASLGVDHPHAGAAALVVESGERKTRDPGSGAVHDRDRGGHAELHLGARGRDGEAREIRARGWIGRGSEFPQAGLVALVGIRPERE